MTERNLGFLGVVAPLIFLIALLALGARRPGYSHLTRPVSELGARGTPAMLAWNVLGFALPGLLLAVFGWRFGLNGNAVSATVDRAAAALLAALGLSIALSGLFPADMAHMRGGATRLHILASLFGLLWVPGAFIWAVRQWSRWRAAATVTAVAALLFLFALGLNGTMPRGLAQRLRFAIVLGWALASGLLVLGRASKANAASQPDSMHPHST